MYNYDIRMYPNDVCSIERGNNNKKRGLSTSSRYVYCAMTQKTSYAVKFMTHISNKSYIIWFISGPKRKITQW